MYSKDVAFPVYCHECWFSDKWDGIDFGVNYDFLQPFFLQIKDLLNAVPKMDLFQRNSIDCQYTNYVGESKNVYLSQSVIESSENIFYSKLIDKSFNIFDSCSVTNSDHCYENVGVDRNYSSMFAILSRNCINCHFIFDCTNCKDCVLSSNLRNKQYFIRNKAYSKNDYFQKISKMDFGSKILSDQYFKEFLNIKEKSLHKYADIIKANTSTGNHIMNAKNAKNCFEAHEVENVKNCYRIVRASDFFDTDYSGLGSEMFYEYITAGKNSFNVKFSVAAFDAVRESEYTDYCTSCLHCFGCVGLKNKQYCILNKQYTKEEYETLVPKIIAHMNEMPYVDKKGRVYKYGEFFPTEISPFAYNETIAQEYFPLTKEEALNQGYSWKDPEEKNYQVEIKTEDIPDNIKDVNEDIVGKIIECNHKGNCNHQCTTAFKIIPQELQFYKKMNLPLPRLCPNCRHYERLKQRNPLKLWHRKCMKPGCENEFETSYAPDRPEIIYCESCYNQEVA